MILGITATRGQLTVAQADNLERWIHDPDVTEVHHGDCKGGDELAHSMALIARKPIVIHPPTVELHRAFCHRKVTWWAFGRNYEKMAEIVWLFPPVNREPDFTVLEPLPYLKRNHDIVDTCDFLLALPGTEQEIVRSGTWATIRYARKVGRPHEIVTP